MGGWSVGRCRSVCRLANDTRSGVGERRGRRAAPSSMLLLSRVYEIPGARILDRLIDRVHAIEGEREAEIPPPSWKPIETAEKGLSIRLLLLSQDTTILLADHFLRAAFNPCFRRWITRSFVTRWLTNIRARLCFVRDFLVMKRGNCSCWYKNVVQYLLGYV